MTDAPNLFANSLILVIDDEETQRLITRDTLEQEGFKVEEASNGEDGLKIIRKARPDLILLDVMMPGIDGFEVCRQIRADQDICNTPIIIVTGREGVEDIQKGFAEGASDFLTKPVVWNLLPNRVRYVLSSNRLEYNLRIEKERAEQASEAKSTLLSTMGHELRTPLNAIIGFSSIMQQATFGPIGSPRYEEYVVDIQYSGMRLLDAVNSILEIVSCESGILESESETILIAELINSVLDKITLEADALHTQIVNNIVGDGACIIGDKERLRWALFNLVSNAVKFTDEGGIVHVSMTHQKNNEIVITIADNGIGISREDLPRIMEPFEQADHRVARKYEGLGLGIPLARAMLRMHGGVVKIESELGKGTTARITLPISRN